MGNNNRWLRLHDVSMAGWLVFFSPSSETWVLTMVVSAIRRTQAHARFPLVLSD